MVNFEEVRDEPTSMGLEQKIAVMLAYMFGWVSGLVFFFVEKRNRTVRFAAMQSIFVSGVWFALAVVFAILSLIPYVGWLFVILNTLLWITMIIVVVFLIVFNFQNKRVVLPVVGEIVERIVARASV